MFMSRMDPLDINMASDIACPPANTYCTTHVLKSSVDFVYLRLHRVRFISTYYYKYI